MKETKVKGLGVDNIACNESDKQKVLSFIDESQKNKALASIQASEAIQII